MSSKKDLEKVEAISKEFKEAWDNLGQIILELSHVTKVDPMEIEYLTIMDKQFKKLRKMLKKRI